METGAYPSQQGGYPNPKLGYQSPPALPGPNPVARENAEEDSAGIDFWGILRRRFFLMGFVVLSTVALSVVYLMYAPKRYESTAQIQIIPKKPVSVDLGQGSFSRNYQDPLSASHANTMLSTRVIEDVLLGLSSDDPDLAAAGRLINAATFADMADPEARNQVNQEMFEYIAENLVITQDDDDEYMFELAFRSKYVDDPEAFLESLIRAYHKSLTSNYQGDIKETIEKLDDVSLNFDRQLQEVDRKIAKFRRENPIPKIDNDGYTFARAILDELFPQYESAKSELEELQLVRQQVKTFIENGTDATTILDILLDEEARRDGNDQAIIQRDLIEKLREEIGELIVYRSSLDGRYAAKHPKMISVNEQIKLKQTLLEDRLKNSQHSDIPADERLRLQVQKLDAQIKAQTAVVEGAFQQLETSRRQAEEYAKNIAQEQELLSERDSVFDMLASAKQKLEEFRVAGADDGYKFETIQRPTEGKQVEPSPLIVLGLGIVLGSLAGFGIAYLVDTADKTFRSPHEIIRTLNLPLIGHIPVIRLNKRALKQNSQLHPVAATFHNPKSQSAEAFRAVRTAIYFSTQGQKHQVIQVTSATPGDGKSTLSANLAITIAQSGKRVLLVDADMRRPSIHKLFTIEESPGFSDVLVEEVGLKEAIRESEVEGLDILPCGNKPVQPSELLTSYRLPEVIEELRQMYDFVVIDTPPVLVVTDPCPVAATVDGVICTMRIKKNVRVSAERMVEILRSVNANIIGIVVNGVGGQGTYSSQYSYGAYQAGYSSYGYGYAGYSSPNRYGQSDKAYDDGRKAKLTLPARKRIEETVPTSTEE